MTVDELTRGESLELERRVAVAHEGTYERAAGAALALAGILSAAIYWVVFTLPYSLAKLQFYAHLDLERLQIGSKHMQWVLLLALFAEGALYLFAWQAARSLHSPGAWAVVIGGGLLSAAALLFMYPIGSTDIFDYIMHGRMVGIYHVDPFVKVAAQFPRDVFSVYSGWPTATSAYGPLWEILAGGLARLGGGTVFSNVIAFKLVEVLFLAACGLVIALVLQRAAPERAFAGVVLLTWNPIVLYETAGNGHNDVVMVFCILAAAAAIYFRRYVLAILLLVAGALLKFIPVLMLPAAGLIALRELPDWRARLRFVLIGAGLSAAMIALAYAPFWHGLQTLAIDRREKLFTSSLPSTILWALQPSLPLDRAMKVISQAALFATLAFTLLDALRAWRDRSWLSFTRSAFHISMFYVLGTVLFLWPWYSLWPVALAALLPPGGATLLAIVTGLNFAGRPFVYAYLILHRPAGSTPRWVELRLGPAMLGGAWLTALALGVRSAIGSARGAAPGHPRIGR